MHIVRSLTNNGGLLAYSDASWHKPNEIGYDMFGYNVYLMGGLISFASKNLKVVALSSAEAEYAAASYTCKELTFVRNIDTHTHMCGINTTLFFSCKV